MKPAIHITKMKNKIYNFMFPIGGGTVGAATQIKQIALHSHWDIVWDTVLIAGVGAIMGILVKQAYEYLKKVLSEKKKKK